MMRALQIAFALVVAAIFAQPALAADSTCKDLNKTTCESRKTCNWVKGYVRKDKKKVDAYCRSAATDTKKKKKTASAGTNACSKASAADCKKLSSCQWVSGYKKSDGTTVKGSCRVKRTASVKKDKPAKKDEPKKKDTKSTAACNTTNFITCKRLDQCRWVSGFTKSDGTKVKGSCRAKS